MTRTTSTRTRSIVAVGLAAALALPAAALAPPAAASGPRAAEETKQDTAKKDEAAEGDKPAEASKKIPYKPPRRGAPKARVGGGSRGPGDALPALFLLLPEDAGATVEERPALFFYLSRPTALPLEVAITAEKEADPIVELKFEGEKRAGIHRLDLKKNEARLKVGTKYDVGIACIVDAAEGSKNIFAGGKIERIEPPASLAAELARATVPADRARIYAANGIWVEALSTLGDAVDKAAAEKPTRELRADLLRQAGFTVTVKPDAAKSFVEELALPEEKPRAR